MARPKFTLSFGNNEIVSEILLVLNVKYNT